MPQADPGFTLSPQQIGDNVVFWEVGEPINSLGDDGNYPSWETAKSRYWQNRAASARPGEFAPQSLGLMRGGNAPMARVRVRLHSTGKVVEALAVKELHHILGRNIADAHNENNLQELWPWQHDAVDPYRHTGYDFLEFK